MTTLNRLTTGSLEPMNRELADIEQQLADQRRKTQAIKASILRNDAVIAQLLDSKSMVDTH
jgi:hypothetical protein